MKTLRQTTGEVLDECEQLLQSNITGNYLRRYISDIPKGKREGGQNHFNCYQHVIRAWCLKHVMQSKKLEINAKEVSENKQPSWFQISLLAMVPLAVVVRSHATLAAYWWKLAHITNGTAVMTRNNEHYQKVPNTFSNSLHSDQV